MLPGPKVRKAGAEAGAEELGRVLAREVGPGGPVVLRHDDPGHAVELGVAVDEAQGGDLPGGHRPPGVEFARQLPEPVPMGGAGGDVPVVVVDRDVEGRVHGDRAGDVPPDQLARGEILPEVVELEVGDGGHLVVRGDAGRLEDVGVPSRAVEVLAVVVHDVGAAVDPPGPPVHVGAGARVLRRPALPDEPFDDGAPRVGDLAALLRRGG